MGDAMSFAPATITVKKGEILRFRVNKQDRIKHEMVPGTFSRFFPPL